MNSYKILNKQVFSSDNYSLVPIRTEDRFVIMKWRNEQIYHLRQSEPLTEEMQNSYFNNVVSKLFEQEKPSQLLFSYLENGQCIGYGGLVHINWIDRNAEISFIMDTELEKNEFQKHWGIYLELLEQLAFDELKLHKIYTYAFDLRPHLYEAIESCGFEKEATLKEHCLFNGVFKDVIIHAKKNQNISIRTLIESDKDILFEWANDELSRTNSFNSEPIGYETHSNWFDKKIESPEANYYICEVNNIPAGLVRFDKDNDKVIVGITIDKKFRGKKLASVFLKKACREFQEVSNSPITAFIKKQNLTSIRSFEKAGFTFSKELIIKDIHTYEYVLRKQQ